VPLAPFVHLRVRSCFSLLSSTVRFPELVARCREHAMPAVGVADEANLFGVMQFCDAAVQAGIQPIVGLLLPLRLGAAEDLRARRRVPPRAPVVLLAQDEEGYGNLLKLASRAHLESPDGEPALDPEALLAASSGLLCLTGGAGGALGRLLQDGREAEAEALLERLIRAFPGRLYVEIQRHGLPAEAATEARFLEWAYGLDLPLVATQDVRFLDVDMHEATEALSCIGAGTTLDDPGRPRLSPEQRFKTPAEMLELFADLPEATANTLVIARRCAVAAPKRRPILPRYPTEGDRSEAEELRARARAGLEERLFHHVLPRFPEERHAEVRRAYAARLEYELDVIERMGFPGYFLIVADFIRWAKEHGIPVGPGRGSGAGSLVAWAMHITELDPIRWGLLFERFLNPERVSMPDFDVDFCQDRRDEVIDYVRRRYGEDRVAHIITFGKLQARAVLRDVGRVLGLPNGLVDRIAKLVPHNPANPPSLDEAVEMEPRLREFAESDPQVARALAIARRLEGLPRHASTHAAGVVIGDRPLIELIPLYRDPRSEMAITQFDMKDVEKAGLVKFDFLGLTTLTMLRMAEELVNRSGTPLDLSKIPLDDRPTYELLSRAETAGVFQLESGGMRDALRRLRPDRFEDLIAILSLYRPGPMDNIPRYVNVKHGIEQPSYLHPALEPILAETHGVIVYQEQVMEIARQLAGYTLGGADLLRRAMGKKIKEEMDAQRDVFVRGALERGIPADVAGAIFDQVAKFASYGFNKSHAAAYALLAYQTAYLKANHPVEFFAAVLTMEMANHDKLAAYRHEMRTRGIPLYPPDINASGLRFEVEDGPAGRGVRHALPALKGVGEAVIREVVREREARGPFRDLFDFAARLGPKVINRRILEVLVRAGAFDSLEPNRRRLYEAIDAALRHAQAVERARAEAQSGLFGDALLPEPPALPHVEDWPHFERLQHEMSVVGFYLSSHPLEALLPDLERAGVLLAAHLFEDPQRLAGRRVKLAGVVVGKQERRSHSGNRFAFVQMSDPTARFEVTVFSDLLARVRDLLDARDPLVVEAEVRTDGEELRLTAESLEPLDRVVAQAARELRLEVEVDGPEALERVAALLEPAEGGRGGLPLLLLLRTGPGERTVVELPPDLVVPAVRRADLERLPNVRVRQPAA